MAKFHNVAKEILEELEKGNYLSAVIKLQSGDILSTVNELLSKDVKKYTENEIDGLRNVIKASKSIYELNQYMSGVIYKLIPDYMYDILIEKYKSLNLDDEPFQSFVPSGMRSEKQDFPELSGTLNKAYEIYDISDKPSVEKWLRKIMKELNVKHLELMIVPKFDGTSVTVSHELANVKTKLSSTKGLIFSNYIALPVKAITRGDFDNNLGVDMFNIMRGRPALEIDESIQELLPSKVGVQYEAMITEYGRENLSKAVGIKYSTRRAAIAAALKRISNAKTPDVELREINKCVTLVPLMFDFNTLQTLEKNKIEFINAMDILSGSFAHNDAKQSLLYEINVIEESNIANILEKFEKLVQEYVQMRNNLNYSIDGLVLTVANYSQINELGRSSNKNKWQIAYKFDAMVQRTKITGIISSMGKQGFIGHNITFDPIEFNGVGYVKAPVNNVTRFKTLDPHIGDEVLVSYNADVMGYIYKDDSCKIKGDVAIPLPNSCINCGAELEIHKDMLKCVNESCPGHKVGRILEAIRILNLDYFGEETANDIVMKADISSTLDFIKMSYDDLAKVLKGVNLEKAWEEFQNKIKTPISYAKVIDLLRIPGLRTKTAEKILDDININDLREMMNDSDLKKLHKSLERVKGINKKAKEYAEGLIAGYDEFQELTALLKCINPDKVEYSKNILISGFRSNPEFDEICKRMNFNVMESGSNFDILVVTPDRFNGSKANKARKKGQNIMILSRFIEMYK